MLVLSGANHRRPRLGLHPVERLVRIGPAVGWLLRAPAGFFSREPCGIIMMMMRVRAKARARHFL